MSDDNDAPWNAEIESETGDEVTKEEVYDAECPNCGERVGQHNIFTTDEGTAVRCLYELSEDS